MFYVNIFTGKTMKINKKSWKQLKIYGDFLNRELCISLLDSYMVGSEDRNNFSLIYFDNKDQKRIEMILNEKKIIKNWMWNDIVEKNWNKKCKDFFKPVTINDKIQIIPFWEETNQDYLTIKINPALAFGTGHHETTYMMIQAILDLNLDNINALDIGTILTRNQVIPHKSDCFSPFFLVKRDLWRQNTIRAFCYLLCERKGPQCLCHVVCVSNMWLRPLAASDDNTDVAEAEIRHP